MSSYFFIDDRGGATVSTTAAKNRVWICPRANKMVASFYQFQAKPLGSETPISMQHYAGQVVLIVNTASHCYFTPQYQALETLYQRYREKGFVILGFPCNEFAQQEPAQADMIQHFCTTKYHITFPLFEKVTVNGANAHPLFTFLRKACKGWFGERIQWNFTKFLIDSHGIPIQRFAPMTSPLKLEKAIQKLLKTL